MLVNADGHGSRLDRFLAERLKDHGISRERVKGQIRDGLVTVDGKTERSPKTAIRHGAVVALTIAAPSTDIEIEYGELDVLYRDAVLAVINKPAGLTTHPAPGLASGTLANRLPSHFPELAGQAGQRPGIVHRLDKDTSGLMLVALSEECRLALAAMFAGHEIKKHYLALVRGVPAQAEGIIDAPVGRHPTLKTRMAVLPGGKMAKSAWQLLYADPFGRFSLLGVRIFSGRTHQVRVHMLHLGHPLLGDSVYGGGHEPGAAQRQMLHAWKLALRHPLPDKAGAALVGAPGHEPGGDAALSFCCPPPQDFFDTVLGLCRRHLRVVLTGLPGCGKSALLARLKENGAPVFSADACVAELYSPGRDGHRLLAARYGERFVPEPCEPVDKTALGTAMRDSDILRREVEAMLHPLVFSALQDFWQEHEDADIAVAEVPLYLECGRAGQVAVHERPVLVGVGCPFAIRQKRLASSRGWNQETAARMQSWQWPEDRKMAACDMVVDNSGTLEQLDSATGDLLRDLNALRLRRNSDAAAAVAACWGCGDPDC